MRPEHSSFVQNRGNTIQIIKNNLSPLSIMFIKEIELKKGFDEKIHPFNLNFIKFLEKNPIQIKSNIVFLIGENGSGKTTLIEAMACYFGLDKFGGSKAFIKKDDAPLSDFLVIPKRHPHKDIYFFRAETFFNLEEELKKYGMHEKDHSLVHKYTNSNKTFRQMSHGQGFKTFFKNRIGEKGLYFFDEPETALSIQNQIEFLFMLKEFEKRDCQIFIATHSPILLAYPKAQILSIGDSIEEVKYEETENFSETKRFLNNYKRFQWELEKD